MALKLSEMTERECELFRQLLWNAADAEVAALRSTGDGYAAGYAAGSLAAIRSVVEMEEGDLSLFVRKLACIRQGLASLSEKQAKHVESCILDLIGTKEVR